MTRASVWPAILVLACLARPAFAEDDKSREDAMFSDDEAEKPAVAPAAEATAGADEDSRRLSGTAVENTELLSRDRTQIGGFFYTRNSASYGQGAELKDIGLGNSTLFDTYFDSRVNERLRAYLRARILYNPNADASGALPALGQTSTEEVRYVLDQLWLKFDIYRHVFVTLGRQHVRFGATRIWNPVDVINPQKFNPLTFFDERTGVPMLKLHVPFFDEKWNWYGLLLNDNATTVERVGVASRLEGVFGTAEIGLTGLLKKGQDAKTGIDVSWGVGDFDLIGEFGATLHGVDDVAWTTAAGAAWTWPYREDDMLILSAEYFHNPAGVTLQTVSDAYEKAFLAADPSKVTFPAYAPLYTGRNYVSAIATVVSPGNWTNSSLTALVITNLTDRSGIGRLSFVTVALTDLTIETFISGNWGDGEFRGYVPVLQGKLDAAIPTVRAFDPATAATLQATRDALHAPLLGAGFNLRVNL